LENLDGRDHSGNPGVDRRKILNWILKNKVQGCGLVLSGSGKTT
jgi:hypothetical protein